MDFLANQIILKSSNRYVGIYKFFRETYSIKYHELFTLVASLGFVRNNKEQTTEKSNGIEFRSNYFNNSQKSSIYSIILNDPEVGKQVEKFDDEDSILIYRKLIEDYAEGGMSILIDEVFGKKWNGVTLDDDYTEYDVDIISFYLAYQQQVPF